MASKLELMLEANKRGLLTGRKKELIDEYLRRNGDVPELIRRPMLEQTETYDMSDPDAGSILDTGLSGATLGWSDEAMGGIANIYAKMHEIVTGEENDVDIYSATRKARKDKQAFTERNPKTAIASEIAGGFATGGIGGAKVLGSNAVRQLPKFMQLLATSAVAGTEGAIYGFGEGEGYENSMDNAKSSAAIAAVMGPAMQWGGNKLMRWWQTGKAKMLNEAFSPTMTKEGLKQASQAHYRKLEAAGFAIDETFYRKFINTLSDEIDNTGVTGEIKQPLSKALKELKALKNPTYRELEKAKEMLGSARMHENKATRQYANHISNSIDDMIADLKPANVVAGTVDDLAESMEKAKLYWARKAQLETVRRMERNAAFSEEAIFDDYDKAMRNQARPYVTSEKKALGLDEEVGLKLEDMILGTGDKNVARHLAGWSPGEATGRGIPAIASGLIAGIFAGSMSGDASTGMAVGTAAAFLPWMAGLIGRKRASMITRRELKIIENLILNKDQPGLEAVLTAIIHPNVNAGMATGLSTIAGSDAVSEAFNRGLPDPMDTNLDDLMTSP